MTFRYQAPRWSTKNLMTFRRVAVVPSEPIIKGLETYTFRLNPSQLQVTRAKLESWKLTKGGFERQFWQNDMVRFAYTGVSGAFRADEKAVINEQGLLGVDTFGGRVIVTATNPGEYDIRETLAYRKFQQFEQFYRDHAEDFIRMNYWGQPYSWKGSLNDFTYNVDANNPRLIRYSFTFTGIPDDNEANVQSLNVQTRVGDDEAV